MPAPKQIYQFPAAAPFNGSELLALSQNINGTAITSNAPVSDLAAPLGITTLEAQVTANTIGIEELNSALGGAYTPLSTGTVTLTGSSTFVADTAIVARSAILLQFSAQNNVASSLLAGTWSVPVISIVPGVGFTILSTSSGDVTRVSYINTLGMPASGSLPTGVVPTDAFDFSQNAFPNRAICQRNSPGWYWNASGVRTQAGINQPRLDYGPYLAGWLAGTPYVTATLRESAATNYFVGTTFCSDNPAAGTYAVCLPTGIYSMWVQSSVANQATSTDSATVAAGSATITGAGAATNNSTLACTGATVLGGKYTYGQWINFTVTVSGTVNVTIAGYPVYVAIEQGLANCPSSQIPTTVNGGPVTRAADQIQVLPPYNTNTSGCTLVAAFIGAASYAKVVANPVIFEYNEGDGNVGIALAIIAGTGYVYGPAGTTAGMASYGVPVVAAVSAGSTGAVGANGNIVNNTAFVSIPTNIVNPGQGGGSATGNFTSFFNCGYVGGRFSNSGSQAANSLHGWVMNAGYFSLSMLALQVQEYTGLYPTLFNDPITPVAPSQRTTFLQTVAAAGRPLLGAVVGGGLAGGAFQADRFEQYLGRRLEIMQDYSADDSYSDMAGFGSNVVVWNTDQACQPVGYVSSSAVFTVLFFSSGFFIPLGTPITGGTLPGGTTVQSQLTGSGTAQASIAAATISGNTLTVTSVTSGTILGVAGNVLLVGAGIPAGTLITSFEGGTMGGVGTYGLNTSLTISTPQAMTTEATGGAGTYQLSAGSTQSQQTFTVQSNRALNTPQFCPGTSSGSASVSNRNLSVSLAMCTSTDISLADVAAGLYDSYYQSVGAAIAAHYPDAVIRLGWEFNGANAFPWALFNNAGATAANFIAAFQHLVTLLKGYSTNFTFCFCPISTQVGFSGATNAPDWETYYPGDAYVDVLDMDVYFNQQYMAISNSAPGAGGWEQTLGGPRGLLALKCFAEQHGKYMGFSEWGFGTSSGAATAASADLSAAMQYFSQFVLTNNVAYTMEWAETNGFYSQFFDPNLVPPPFTVTSPISLLCPYTYNAAATLSQGRSPYSPVQVMMRGSGALLCQPSAASGAAVGTGFGVCTAGLVSAQATGVVGNTGGVSSTTLNVTAGSGILPGMAVVDAAGATSGAFIVRQLTGVYGGVGTYLLAEAITLPNASALFAGMGSLQLQLSAAGNITVSNYGTVSWATVCPFYYPNTAAVYYQTFAQWAPVWTSNTA